MLTDVVENYIGIQRATGRVFRTQSGLLRNFARYAEVRGEDTVRAAAVLEWAARGPTAGTCHGRLQVVRRFARFVHAEDTRHEIPPAGAFGPRPARRVPYIYSPTEIQRLLEAAADLAPRDSLRPKTYVTMLGLIAATGLRISEALALRNDDITSDGLVIIETKFRKSRLVPMHPTTRCVLNKYLFEREKHADTDQPVFVSEWGTGLCYSTVIGTFLKLVRRIGIHPGAGMKGPRIHDLRHTFAVRSLEQCSGDRDVIARHMVALSTYLGHTHITDTYWYLEATPCLLAEVAVRSEALAQGGER